jgi:hypothetical protein
MKRAFEVVLLVAVLALVAALLIPRPMRRPPKASATPAPTALSGTAPSESEAAPVLEPDRIAAAFGWRPPPPPPPPPPPAPQQAVEAPAEPEPPAAPEKADWLIFTGLVVDGTNRTLYMFKDKTTGRAVSLVVGEDHGGWILRDVTTDRFLAEKDGELFTIPR